MSVDLVFNLSGKGFSYPETGKIWNNTGKTKQLSEMGFALAARNLVFGWITK